MRSGWNDLNPDDSFAAVMEPARRALEWVGALRSGDFSAVWAGLDSDFRLALVQGWIVRNPAVLRRPEASLGRDQLARDLSTEDPQHRLWPHCRRVLERELVGATAGVADHELAPGTRPRPMAPGLELIRLFPVDLLPRDAEGQPFFAAGQVVMSLSLITSHGQAGWVVAGIGEGVLRPGWPPEYQFLVRPED